MNGNIVGAVARITVEEYYNEDMFEALEALAMEGVGEEPTPEMEAAERDAAGYGLDDRALCIGDETDDGTPIPEWAFC